MQAEDIERAGVIFPPAAQGLNVAPRQEGGDLYDVRRGDAIGRA